MDAGLAAVLGAAVGVIGTAATSVTTAGVTRWQVRVKIQAEREDRRAESRRDAYKNLFRTVTAVRSAISETADALRAQPVNPDKCDGLFSVARALGRDWDAACASLLIEGPEAVAQAAWPLISTVNRECDLVRDWCSAVRRKDLTTAEKRSEAYRRSAKESGENMDAFVAVVQAVPYLTNIGT